MFHKDMLNNDKENKSVHVLETIGDNVCLTIHYLTCML
jgi:hypothetical protein